MIRHKRENPDDNCKIDKVGNMRHKMVKDWNNHTVAGAITTYCNELNGKDFLLDLIRCYRRKKKQSTR